MNWALAAVVWAMGTSVAQDDWQGTQDQPAPTEQATPAPQTLAEVWAGMGADDLLSEAVSRRALGDYEGADGRLAVLLASGDLTVQAHYHQGISHEFQERYDAAVASYEAVITGWPDTEDADSAAFRRALCLEDLGRHAESLAAARELVARRGWDERDETSLSLQRGVTELRSGKARRGIKHIDAALSVFEGTDELTWMRAKARTALARHMLRSAAEVRLVGNKKAARNLRKRAGLLSGAEKQIVAVARLGEPEYALEGLLLLGDAYVSLHDDLLAAPPPAKLDDTQKQMYSEAIGERAAMLKTKAYRYYDEGVTVAVRTRWQGHLAADLQARRDSVAP